ncbi:MAG: hypothetical protein JXR16_04895 [Bermanella sp.]
MKTLLERLINWLGIPKQSAEYRWSQTRSYNKRIELVKNLWIGGGIVMLIVAQPAFIAGFSLFITFLSFAFLER